MAQTPKNRGKEWTKQDVQQLKLLAKQNTPTRVIALKMQRTEASIYGKAGAEGISLGPTNQSPYSRLKK